MDIRGTQDKYESERAKERERPGHEYEQRVKPYTKY